MKIKTLANLLKAGKRYGQIKSGKLEASNTEINICAYLYFHSDVSQDHIAQELLMDKTTVAKALLKLEQKQLVQREANPKNRRENKITLTGLGLEQVSHIAHLQKEWIEQVCSCLTEQERIAFDEISEKLLQNAWKILEECTNDR